LEATTTEGERRLVSARLTVAADGRTSSLVDMAGIATRETANNRFSCFAFFKNIPDEDRSRSRMWLLEPEVGYQFPNDGDTTLIAIMPLKSRLAAYKADPESCFTRFVEALREAPRIAGAERVSKVMMYARNSNLIRGAAPDGMTLLGDAAMTSDPLAGVGISWAFLSAEWLVDLVSEPLLLGRPLRAALRAYRRRHWWELRAHHKTIADLSQGGELNAIQKLLFSAGTRDARTAELINDFLARDIGVAQFLSPAALMRAAGVNFRHALRAREGHARGADESLTEA